MNTTHTLTAQSVSPSPLAVRFCLWRASKRAAKLALVGAATLKASNAIAPRTFAGDTREAAQAMARTVEARHTRADSLTEESESLTAASRIALEADTLPAGMGWSGEASYLLTRAERARLAAEWTPKPRAVPVNAAQVTPAEVFAPREVPPYESLVPAEVREGASAILAFEAAVGAAPLMLTA